MAAALVSSRLSHSTSACRKHKATLSTASWQLATAHPGSCAALQQAQRALTTPTRLLLGELRAHDGLQGAPVPCQQVVPHRVPCAQPSTACVHAPGERCLTHA